MAERNGGKQSDNNKNRNANNQNGYRCGNDKNPLFAHLTPQQFAVIAALLTNALSVDSILIDKNQQIQIILGGSFRKKTRTDQLLKELGNLKVNDILDSLKNQFLQ